MAKGKMVNIRVAKFEDIGEIKALIDSLQVSRKQQDWEQRKDGLFEYPKSEQELERVLNPYFIVAETEQGIRGFFLGYDDNFFKHRFSDSQEEEFRFVLDNVRGDFVYLDQGEGGVANSESLGKGRIVLGLWESFVSKAVRDRKDKIITYVCHKPLLNVRSKRFVEGRGFHNFEEIPIGDGIFLGAYELNLNEDRR
jgi:hypothetical protein